MRQIFEKSHWTEKRQVFFIALDYWSVEGAGKYRNFASPDSNSWLYPSLWRLTSFDSFWLKKSSLNTKTPETSFLFWKFWGPIWSKIASSLDFSRISDPLFLQLLCFFLRPRPQRQFLCSIKEASSSIPGIVRYIEILNGQKMLLMQEFQNFAFPKLAVDFLDQVFLRPNFLFNMACTIKILSFLDSFSIVIKRKYPKVSIVNCCFVQITHLQNYRLEVFYQGSIPQFCTMYRIVQLWNLS